MSFAILYLGPTVEVVNKLLSQEVSSNILPRLTLPAGPF